jgi:alkylation response protein AidB-like acyl-CoA dehydrogenase
VVEKEVVPVAQQHEHAGRPATALLPHLAELGVLSAALPADEGGLALPPAVCALLVEEIARGWGSLGSLVGSHLTATRTLAAAGARALLGRLGRGDALAAVALHGAVALRGGATDGMPRGIAGDVVLSGRTALTDGVGTAEVLLVAAGDPRGRQVLVVIPRSAAGVRVESAGPVIGLRGAEPARVTLQDVRAPRDAVLAGDALDGALAFAHLMTAALGIGIAQAAFEAALRYSQQRSAFGKPISQHQAIQLKLADMATAVSAARLLVTDAGVDPVRATVAKLQASAAASRVTLESMRTHGGYGYTNEFPVERHYRDAARLLLAPIPEDSARATAAARLLTRETHDAPPDG